MLVLFCCYKIDILFMGANFKVHMQDLTKTKRKTHGLPEAT